MAGAGQETSWGLMSAAMAEEVVESVLVETTAGDGPANAGGDGWFQSRVFDPGVK